MHFWFKAICFSIVRLQSFRNCLKLLESRIIQGSCCHQHVHCVKLCTHFFELFIPSIRNWAGKSQTRHCRTQICIYIYIYTYNTYTVFIISITMLHQPMFLRCLNVSYVLLEIDRLVLTSCDSRACSIVSYTFGNLCVR